MNKANEWNKVGGGDFPPTYRFDDKGQQIVGLFVEKRTVTSEKIESGSSNVYVVDVLEDSANQVSGKVSIWGSGMIDWLFGNDKVKAGDTVRLTYQGKREIKRGKKKYMMNDYTLEVKA